MISSIYVQMFWKEKRKNRTRVTHMMRLLREIKIELYTSVLLQYHLPVLLFHR